MAGAARPAAPPGGVDAERPLVIDWGQLAGTGIVFCAVLVWSRVRFVGFARDETAATTFALLPECYETLGGVPAKILSDRIGSLQAGLWPTW